MARCTHGFERGGNVACPSGCHGSLNRAPRRTLTNAERTRSITDAAIAETLAACGTTVGAARVLGVDPTTIRNRAERSDAIRHELATRDRSKTRHSIFVSMVGWTGQGWTVIEEATRSARGNARWKAQHHCGAIDVVDGSQLRRCAPKTCSSCRAARAGSANRRPA